MSCKGCNKGCHCCQNSNSSVVKFFINGKEYTVSKDEFGPDYPLVDFIRDNAGLKGTKYMCREGGCGACVVTARKKNPGSGVETHRSINSCLTPVLACEGWDISTVERLGNFKNGYHPIQENIVKFSGTQCGYCTPGFVMNMYGVLESNKDSKPTSKEIIESFDGNICRCTGYRPIMDAFKLFASDAPEELKRKCADIEECNGCPKRKENGGGGNSGSGCCSLVREPSKIRMKLKTGEDWIKPLTLSELFDAIGKLKDSKIKYRLIGGNTSTGIFKDDFCDGVQAYIDLGAIPELNQTDISTGKNSIFIGAGTTLTDAIQLYKKVSERPGFEYCSQLSTHIKRVANVPVRNVGTVSGNLMIKHAHNDFPSDIFTIHEAIGGKLIIATSPSSKQAYSLEEFLKVDMVGKVIIGLELPVMSLEKNKTCSILPKLKQSSTVGYHFKSYKITQRYQNTHAYINAGFLIKVDQSGKILEKPRIVFAGVNDKFIHATETEKFLDGKSLTDPKVLQGAMETLGNEVKPDHILPDATPEYRRKLTQSLLYKTILNILDTKVSAKNQSGANNLDRPVSKGKQIYDSDKSRWPINKPVTKLEGPAQASGEAEYAGDIVKQNGELFGAFVLSEVANCELDQVDVSEALKMEGVVKFVSARDIPGENSSQGVLMPGMPNEPEEIFSSGKISFAGQPVGLILAEDRATAFKAVKKVKVTYKNRQEPILTIEDFERAQKTKDDWKVPQNSKNRVNGHFKIGAQYHFTMETQTCLCVPKEDGIMDIYPAAQAVDLVQKQVSKVLQIPSHKINVQVRRLGGGLGSKITKSNKVATAAAIGAFVTQRPVKIVLDIETNMKLIGYRLPYSAKYDCGFEDNGKITDLSMKIMCDAGANINESEAFFAKLTIQNLYQVNSWNIVPDTAITHTHPNTSARAPGSTQGIAFIENIMEHISKSLNKDPIEVRKANMLKTGDSIPYTFTGQPEEYKHENLIPKMLPEIISSSNFEARKKEIEVFNSSNRWKKRGISLVPMRYPMHYLPGLNFNFQCMVVVYASDGTVAIKHSGVEMGQGLNTKAAQGVAYTLGIPLEKVKVKPTDNFVGPNGMVTGGAVSSELVCYASMKACEIILERIKPARANLGENASWEAVISNANMMGVDLAASYRIDPMKENISLYDVWGINITEVEIDVLTGEYRVVRLDMLEDVGKSLSQEVDVGQIEGCLVMGIGLWLTEKIVYDPKTGQMLTNNTWHYKPPEVMDIPGEMNITMLKNAPNPHGILNSKATGEPAICSAVAVLFAMRNAIYSARKDSTGKDEYFDIHGPLTPEDVLKYCLTEKSQFSI